MISERIFKHFGISNQIPIRNVVTNKITHIEYTVKAFCGAIPKSVIEVAGDFNASYECDKCQEIADKVETMVEYHELKRIIAGSDEKR